MSYIAPILAIPGPLESGHPCPFCQSAKKEESAGKNKLLSQLKKRDQEVRKHELAHLQKAGIYASGGPVYDYEEGPDGCSYAVGGHVPVSLAEILGNPKATFEMAKAVKSAALAPDDPSEQDFRVAAMAERLMQKARAELAKTSSLYSSFSIVG